MRRFYLKIFRHMKQRLIKLTVALVSMITILPLSAQRVLTLEECKEMALQNNNELKVANQKAAISTIDKKIAASYYYPKISALGTYQWNDKKLPLVSSSTLDAIKELDVAELGLADKLVFDIQNVYAGLVTVQQPIFAGGKIIASNQMAKYAKMLADVQIEQTAQEVEVSIEQSYWQIVSIACKKALAESYSALLHKMSEDTKELMKEGLATVGDSLSVEVKCNEADMLLIKATNGLVLSKMLLCQKTGLPLETEIMLADEASAEIPQPEAVTLMSMEEILTNRPEIQSLELAEKIYGRKVAIARADMMPVLAATANFLVSNPSMNDGFKKEFGTRFAAGVVLKVPVFHGTEALQKTRKAKAEAELIDLKMEDAKEKITLQVSQSRRLFEEASSKMSMARNQSSVAEQNLRSANEGYTEGVISATVLMGAQTAWLQARSQLIETAVELQMASMNLAKAEGRL